MNTACTQQEEPPRQPLRKLTGFFRRQWILIVTLTAIFTAGALLVAYFLNDRYVASTLLLIDKAEAQLSNSKVNVLPSVGTEIEIMRSDAIYWKVAIELGYADNTKPISNRIGGASKPPDDTPQTASTSETAPLPVPSQKLLADSSSPIVDSNIKVPSHVIRELKKKIKIRQRGESEVIAVEAKADTPQEAAMLSRVFTKVYLAEHVRSKRKFIEEVEQALEDRVASLRKQDKNSNSNIDTAVRNFSSQYIARYKLVELNRHAVLPHIRVASWAVEPDRASFPQRKLIAIAGVLAAIQAAIAIALIVDLNFTGVSSLRELELASGVWNIGLIPGAGLKRTQRKKYQDWVIDLPSSPFSRSIQKLYHGIDLLLQQRRLPTSVMVTSMNKKLRHDVIAVALARSAALSGKKAVADLGGTTVLFSTPPSPTCSNISNEILTLSSLSHRVCNRRITSFCRLFVPV
ncbi:MAG: Wzz/FepE/Etk N-terminal domain-containing protein [Alphaproteobacteria bacterium]